MTDESAMGPGPDRPIEELVDWIIRFHDACRRDGRKTTRLFDQTKRLAEEVRRLCGETNLQTWTGGDGNPPGITMRISE